MDVQGELRWTWRWGERWSGGAVGGGGGGGIYIGEGPQCSRSTAIHWAEWTGGQWAVRRYGATVVLLFRLPFLTGLLCQSSVVAHYQLSDWRKWGDTDGWFSSGGHGLWEGAPLSQHSLSLWLILYTRSLRLAEERLLSLLVVEKIAERTLHWVIMRKLKKTKLVFINGVKY